MQKEPHMPESQSASDVVRRDAPYGNRLLQQFREIVGEDGLIAAEDELLVYECDGYVVEKKVPDVVLFPTTIGQIAPVE
jgi:glycolate oxidase